MNNMTEKLESSELALRPINCEMNQLSMPDGSAMLMQGDTTVICGVYGPVEGKMTKLLYDRAVVEVTYSPAKGPPKVDDRLMESYLKETCGAALMVMLHPSTEICINVQELQNCGGLLACAINAACLALINSGLAMKFTIAAISCMIHKESQEIILDPNDVQLQDAEAEFTFAFDSIKKDLVCCHTIGSFTESQLLACMDKCQSISHHIFDFYRNLVTKYVNLI